MPPHLIIAIQVDEKEAVLWQPSSAHIRGGAANVDQIDLFCPSCGYNLHGIPPRRCPECGFGYDIAAMLDVTAGEFATVHRVHVSALIRAVYAVSAALPAFALALQVGSIATFMTVLIALRLSGLLRRTCGPDWDWSWVDDIEIILLRTLFLAWPAMILTFFPIVGSILAAVLIGDAVLISYQSTSWLPELRSAVPGFAWRSLRLYQVAGMITLLVALMMTLVPYF